MEGVSITDIPLPYRYTPLKFGARDRSTTSHYYQQLSEMLDRHSSCWALGFSISVSNGSNKVRTPSVDPLLKGI